MTVGCVLATSDDAGAECSKCYGVGVCDTRIHTQNINVSFQGY